MKELNLSNHHVAVNQAKSKKDIEASAAAIVASEMEEGYINPLEEIVMATKLAAYFTQRASSLRGYCLDELKGEKERGALGAKVAMSSTPGTWNYSEPYLDELKDEIKIVQEKCQKQADKDRHHITLSGEVVDLQRAVKTPGGESVKVML